MDQQTAEGDGMKVLQRKLRCVPQSMVCAALLAAALGASAQTQQISLDAIVTPSTVIVKDGRPVTFALRGFIEFKSLAEMFPYVEFQS